MRLTLPRSQLFQTADFDLLFKTGKKFFSQFFIFYYCPVSSQQPANTKKLGVAVSKKSTKTNVKRNWVKRLIRETYRLNQGQFQGFQLLVLGKKDLRKIPKAELQQDLEKSMLMVQSKLKVIVSHA